MPKTNDQIIRSIIRDMHKSARLITDYCHKKNIDVPYITYSTITGANISKYNGFQHVHREQERLNQIITELNRQIVKIHKPYLIPALWLSKFCHRYSQRKYHHSYDGLHDGLHGSDEMKKNWAKEIKKYLEYVSAKFIQINDKLNF